MPAIVARANADPLLNALAAYGGPYLLMELLARRGRPQFSERRYAGNCHACEAVLGDAGAMRAVMPEIAEHALELIVERVAVHRQAFSGSRRAGTGPVSVTEPWFMAESAHV